MFYTYHQRSQNLKFRKPKNMDLAVLENGKLGTLWLRVESTNHFDHSAPAMI